jgi:hypothetical protein
MIVTLKPFLAITDAQAQAIVDRVAPGRRLARIDELLAGEISAVLEIELTDGPPAFVIKVYSEALHWKMQKEVSIACLLEGRPIPVPRILLADDSRSLLDLNFVVMTASTAATSATGNRRSIATRRTRSTGRSARHCG